MRASDHPYFDLSGPVGLAHRGGSAYRPNVGLENTIAAFRAAVELGYRYLETDVHATADGEVVAFHDTHLDRVTDASGAIAGLPWAGVREARIGGREPIPLLGELLDAFPGARINIDIKSDAALEPTARVLTDRDALDRVCLGSFDERRVRRIRRRLGPRAATAAGRAGIAGLRYLPDLVTRLVRTPAPALQIPVTHRTHGRQLTLVTRGLVRRAHAAGKHVHAWFQPWDVEDAAEMNHLLDLGVDGIITDHIDVLRDVFTGRGRTTF